MSIDETSYWAAMDYWTKYRAELMAKIGLYYKDGEWVEE